MLAGLGGCDGQVANIQPQLGLAGFVVGAVAFQTVAGPDRAYITEEIKVFRRRRGRLRQSHQEGRSQATELAEVTNASAPDSREHGHRTKSTLWPKADKPQCPF